MRRLRPNLFHERNFARMSPGQFDAAEASFRANLRKSRPFVNEFRDIDAGRLTSEERDALSKAITGNVNAVDRGALAKARARQRMEDAAINPPRDAA
jgi:hypothetical protein